MKEIKFDIDFTVETVKKNKAGSLFDIDLFRESPMDLIYILEDNIVTMARRIKNLITKRD